MVRVQGHAAAAAGRGRAAGRPDAAPHAAHHWPQCCAALLQGRPAQPPGPSLPPSDGTSRGMGRGAAGSQRARPCSTGPPAQSTLVL